MSEIPVGKKCMVVGCESLVKANNYCAVHYQRSLRHDGDTGETRPKRGTCSVDGCEKPHAAKGLCSLHYYRQQRTGTVNVAPSAERVCDIEGCGKPHVANGLCAMHDKRKRRHGDVIQTRASDWGARERHPLYTTWNTMLRCHGKDVCERWRDLWSFVEDMGGSRPSMSHKLARTDNLRPYGPGNIYWREPHVSGLGEDKRTAANAYMRDWYAANKDKVLDGEMRRRYGIGLDDYERMFDEQNGTCAVCHQEETRVDHRTKKVSRLAVDHDHKTNVVRGLLCHHCNNALCAFDDDLQSIMSATVYLAKHSPDSAAVLKAAIAQLQAALPPDTA